MAIAGGCLCGAVRYQIKADAPLGARYCWCRVWEYPGAGTGAVSAFFRTEDVAVSGPLTDYVCKADSGSTMHRRFCARCGSDVFSEAEERPNLSSCARERSTIQTWRRPRRPSGRNPRQNGHASTPVCLRLKDIRPAKGLTRAAFTRARGPPRSTTMLFMVIERFRDNDMVPVYQRLRQEGRSLRRGSNMSTAGSNATFPAASSSCAPTISG